MRSQFLVRKLENYGLMGEDEKLALLAIIGSSRNIARGQDIVAEGSAPNHCMVLLDGVGCRYKVLENGSRQILNFHYPGDICDISGFVMGAVDYAIGALTPCSVAAISHWDLRKLTESHPNLAILLWRDSIIDAYIFREWLVNVGSRPALSRIAHILCEQMVRLEAIGQDSRIMPITQSELADATGLSAVHINRTIQELREMGIVGRQSRPITILQKERLCEIGNFEGSYLHMPKALESWKQAAEPIMLG